MSSFTLPPEPPAPRPVPLSLVGLLLPLAMAAALWGMTRSPFALLFAAGGPLLGLGGWWERRRHGRRERAAAEAERALALHELAQSVRAAQEAERAALLGAFGGADAALAAPAGSTLWQGSGQPRVLLGYGTLPSAVAVGGRARGEEERRVQASAARLEHAPVVAELAAGIAVVGPRVLALAAARALLVQLAAAWRPESLVIEVPAGEEWAWSAGLPLTVRGGSSGGPMPAPGGGTHPFRVVFHTDPRRAPSWTVGLFAALDDVPPGYGAVVHLDGVERARVHGLSGSGAPVEPFLTPELVCLPVAQEFARALGRRAAQLGLAPAGRVPEEVHFADLPVASGGGLRATIARGADGPFTLDLVADGPHAVVGGMTGSGKSELLISWVTGLAAAHSTAEVNVLLVDFKGGTAFQALRELPHVVGVVTDLAGAEAERALRSLRAELRHRERLLAEAGLRDIAEAGDRMPRLVVVVDELAALLDASPELSALFTDLAARGRALGVHLVLCTQRPAGVVRDALLANCPLRISLRVQSAADSRWLIGTDAAAEPDAAHPGRAVVLRDGRSQVVQTAMTAAADIDAIVVSASAHDLAEGRPRPRRPWLPPLPAVLRRRELGQLTGITDAVVLGLADVPEEQRRELVRYRPADGPLVVLGGPRSGKSSALRTVAAAARFERSLVGADREAAWDAVMAALDRCSSASRGGGLLLLVDDADAIVAALGEEHATAWCEALAQVLRSGPAVGVHGVIAAQRAVPELRPVLALARRTLLLRQPSPREHVLAGGQAALFDDRLPPGGGELDGRRVQLLAPEEPPSSGVGEHPAPLALAQARVEPVGMRSSHAGATAIVSRAPSRARQLLHEAGVPESAVLELSALRLGTSSEPALARAPAGGPGGRVIVGDPESWGANWSLLAQLRARQAVVFLGCSAADVRAVTRSRAPLPPLAPVPGRCWVLHPDGEIIRGQLGA